MTDDALRDPLLSQPADIESSSSIPYLWPNIRALLIQGFSEEDLRRLCFDEFRPVYERLSAKSGTADIVDALIPYVDQTLQAEKLLAWAKTTNPVRYEQHQPYVGVPTVVKAENGPTLEAAPTPQRTVLKRPEVSLPPRVVIKWRYIFLSLAVVALAAGGAIWTNSPNETQQQIFPTCQPLDRPVKVVVTQLSHCSTDAQKTLIAAWNTLAEVKPVMQTFGTAQDIRAYPEAKLVDLAVWGSCGETGQATLNYEFITTRKPDKVYEPTNLSITGSLTEAAKIGSALIRYQHGDHTEAIESFETLPALQTSRELALLRANNLLFAGQYSPAIKAYQVDLLKEWSAAYNNLGVTRFNEWLVKPEGIPQAGLADFEQAIELAQTHHEVLPELLAYVNKSILLQSARHNQETETSCEAALKLNTNSALPYLCDASYTFSRYYLSDNFWLIILPDSLSSYLRSDRAASFERIKQNLDQAEKFADAPATLYYLRATWYREQQQDEAAIEDYQRFLKQMEHRACLPADKVSLKAAAIFLRQLSP